MLSKDFKTEISRLATQFRQAIEVAKEKSEFVADVTFNSFPRGCCGDACYLFGQYLLEHNIESTYVCGNYYYNNSEGDCQSHAWILVNGLIVDLTGDQFKYHKEFNHYSLPVYVGKLDAFHGLFDVEDRDVHPLFGLSHYTDYRLNELYQKIGHYLRH